MNWYDIFAYFYDAALERLYRNYRIRTVEELRLSPGDTVLDLACGTGQNFEPLMEQLGPEGRLFGVDFSAGMLAKASRRCDRNGWKNVYLIEKDARELELSDLEEACGQPVHINRVVVVLGLSVIPDWQSVFAQTFSLLPPGGRYTIFDVYAQRWVPQTWIVQLFARADVSRRVWEPLETISEDFAFRYLEGSPHIHGGRLLLASGTRT